MIIGDLRYKIEILNPVLVKDEYGAENTTWQVFATLRAGKKEISGTKLIDNQEYFNTNRIDWMIHYRRNINENMRVRINNKEYRILYIRELVYKDGLVLETELINN